MKKHKSKPKEVNVEELKQKAKPIDPKEVEKHKDQLLRTMADFENYKKRIQNEKESLIKFSNQTLICEMLPILDNFGRALEHTEIKEGLVLVKKQMEDTFKKFGVSEVETKGKTFDPHFHEAVQKIDSDKPENEIVEVMQKGYILNGRLIRPAMVIISQGKGAKSSGALAQEEN